MIHFVILAVVLHLARSIWRQKRAEENFARRQHLAIRRVLNG